MKETERRPTFTKYQHIERFGSDECDGIEFGDVYVFPKIDGTNGSIWWDGELKFGSRNREISLENDNQGFCEAILNSDVKSALEAFFDVNPGLIVFGEWLVPHSLKTYRPEAWRKFYVFDVMREISGEYLSYPEYKPYLDSFGMDYIPYLAVVHNGTYEQFAKLIESNTYLIDEGKGVGEGIVLKRYDYKNKYGRTTWAKIVRNEFKDLHRKEMGGAEIEGGKMVEDEAVEKFLTSEMINKTYAKISGDGWNSKMIPRLLSTVFYEFINEEIWHILKEFKEPKIDFKTLRHFVINKIKLTKPELF